MNRPLPEAPCSSCQTVHSVVALFSCELCHRGAFCRICLAEHEAVCHAEDRKAAP